MKIALLFGSFNPIHKGHLKIAHTAVTKNLAQQTWLVVSPQNPFKKLQELTDFEHRVNMATLAVQNCNDIKVCQIEKELPTPSYTINTIEKLQAKYPDNQFFILCGSDIVENLDKWHRIDELKKLVEFVVYPRGDNNAQHSPAFDDVELLDISSTKLRNSLVYSELPTGVYDYITEHKLYATESIEELYNKGRDFYAKGDFGNAINAFKNALEIDPSYTKASEMLMMVNEIVAYRHTDIYNP